MDTLAVKKSLLAEAVERKALVFFGHDPAIPAAIVTAQDGKWHIQT
jgi:hypothetical protein